MEAFFSFDSVNFNTDRGEWVVRATFYSQDPQSNALVPLTDLVGIPVPVVSPSLAGIKDALSAMATKVESSRTLDVLGAMDNAGGGPVKFGKNGLAVS